MKGGRIAIFEESDGYIAMIKANITTNGNEVVLSASTPAEAIELIDRRIADLGSLAVDVVLLGDIQQNRTPSDSNTKIADYIREVAGDEPLIVSISIGETVISKSDMKTIGFVRDRTGRSIDKSKNIEHINQIIDGFIGPHELKKYSDQTD